MLQQLLSFEVYITKPYRARYAWRSFDHLVGARIALVGCHSATGLPIALHIGSLLCVNRREAFNARFGSKADMKRLRLMSALPPKADID
jgi:hypothetical protein